MSDTVTIHLQMDSMADYALFLKAKSLPRARFGPRSVTVPAEYASLLGEAIPADARRAAFKPMPCLYDYQRDISAMAIRKRKFAIFAACGLGKTLCLTEWCRAALDELPSSRSALIVSPLMVVSQTIAEAQRFYGDSLPIERVPASRLAEWCAKPTSRLGITNYEAITDRVPQGRIGALALDESSMLKSHYGAWGRRLIQMGKGLEWKLCLTGTPAPNDRIEFANHAVFLDRFPTVNSFLARFFVNRGQTQERWSIKPHALRPFYRALSDWCVFLENPATYGWKDNVGVIPPINVKIHDVPLTEEQVALAGLSGGDLYGSHSGGMVSASILARLAKGWFRGEEVKSLKGPAVRDLVRSEKTPCIVWCRYNAEQDLVARLLPEAGNLSGKTPTHERERIIRAFQNGDIKTLVTKPKCAGFGLNLQVCRRMVFSTLHYSYEEYWQAVKRANRVGSKHPLDVHIPLTELERPMAENVLRKARQVESDTKEQETIFREMALRA